MAMELEVAGQRVTEESADYALSLRTDADYEIRIETDFSMHTPKGDVAFTLGQTSLDPGTFHPLLGRNVTASSTTDTGTLELAFDNGMSLRVEPDDTYEAWTIAGPNGRKIVCMPGGEVALWGEAV
jgi:Family of unknown function (DUF6188)